ncbi:hypothetical protein JI721_14395 [Alicyclobacillus cycloheptanicus]|uniref:Uncharacterized protein n=1 Tax=Alicyclobacillus cycloheptanicus TaxID=1457 RepID=A0ABT9XL81_9BACL|nr:hypothetical protein [Alicyclobacillus cycloheptanicus]MDQ0191066.1 hypothetical protein [Alicyclobacillus cycloheptanicus]WDM00862.1 hypothetical protein JI721_14395 [Alicyclobacillus cycloheptanicus]
MGHVPHGYRRVFAVYEDQTLRHVVNLAHMPYEWVFRVKELAGEAGVEDPSLWWGLSVITSLVSNGTLLGAENPDTADDGYIQIRPQAPTKDDLIPLSIYQAALREGAFVFSH